MSDPSFDPKYRACKRPPLRDKAGRWTTDPRRAHARSSGMTAAQHEGLLVAQCQGLIVAFAISQRQGDDAAWLTLMADLKFPRAILRMALKSEGL